MAQDAETEVLVEAAGSGLVQHLWAPIHSVQLEEAPSVQLGSHQPGATGHIQDQGSMRRAWKGLGKAVHCEAWGTVLQGRDVLGTER